MSGQALVDELRAAESDAATEKYVIEWGAPETADLLRRAADRIEALEAAVDTWTEMAARRHRALGEVEASYREAIARAERAEAENDILRGPESDERDGLITDPLIRAMQEQRARAERAEQASRTNAAEADAALVDLKLARKRRDRAEKAAIEARQKSAELAAVIAEALTIHKPHQVATSGSTVPELPNSFEQRCNWCDTPWPCRTARALSAVPADVLIAYTTRIREEAVAEAATMLEGVAAEPWNRHSSAIAILRQHAARIRSEIPEGQAQ